jgi:hypothetical protein
MGEESGTHTITFYAERYGLASGVYFYQLTGDGVAVTRKMVVLR